MFLRVHAMRPRLAGWSSRQALTRVARSVPCTSGAVSRVLRARAVRLSPPHLCLSNRSPSFSMHAMHRALSQSPSPQTPLLQSPHRNHPSAPQTFRVFRPAHFVWSTQLKFIVAPLLVASCPYFSDSTGVSIAFFDSKSPRGLSHWSLDPKLPSTRARASCSCVHLPRRPSGRPQGGRRWKAQTLGDIYLQGIVVLFSDIILHSSIILVYASVNILSSDRVQPFTHALSNLQ